MAFQLGSIADRKEAGKLKGFQREIACDCWFTSAGKTTPRMIKVMDEEGVIHVIDQIQVLYSEEKTYAGIQTLEHVCQVNMGEKMETVKLVFTKENCRWVMILP